MKHIVVSLLLAPLLAIAQEPYRYESSVDAMGTTFTVAAYHPQKDQLQAAVEASLEEAQRLDRMLSNYRAESEWSQVNRFAAQREVQVSQELFNLLAACVDYSSKSQGSFDISVGPLMRVWGFYKGTGRLPHKAEVRTVMNRVGYKNIVLDRKSIEFQTDPLPEEVVKNRLSFVGTLIFVLSIGPEQNGRRRRLNEITNLKTASAKP